MDLKNNPPAWARRLAGLGIALGGAFVTLLTHRQAAGTGEFSAGGSVIGPAFAVLGIGLLLFKGYRQERLERGEDISGLEGQALLTARWWGVLFVGALAGLLNFGALKGWW
jgi:hypothetical protein